MSFIEPMKTRDCIRSASNKEKRKMQNGRPPKRRPPANCSLRRQESSKQGNASSRRRRKTSASQKHWRGRLSQPHRARRRIQRRLVSFDKGIARLSERQEPLGRQAPSGHWEPSGHRGPLERRRQLWRQIHTLRKPSQKSDSHDRTWGMRWYWYSSLLV